MRFFLAIALVVLLPTLGSSQKSRVDSIIASLAEMGSDTARLKHLSGVTQKLMATDCDQAILLAKYGVEQSELAKQNDLALQFQSILGYSYKAKGDFSTATACFMAVLRKAEAENNTARIASAANNLGSTFLEIEKLKEANYYFSKAISAGQKLHDTLQLARTYANVGYLKAELQQHDSALAYYQKALPVFFKNDDSLRVADMYLNMGRSMLSLKQNTSAKQFFEKALELFTHFGDTDGACRTYLNLADVALATNDYQKALDINLKALALANADHSDYLRDFCYQNISACYVELNDYKNALLYFRRHSALNDSINSLEKHRQIVDLQEKYQSNLKDKQLLEAENAMNKKEKQRLVLIIILAASGVVLTVLVFYFLKAKQYNARLETLVKEKEFLMQEVHHRVTNNLQLLSSLLELQIRGSADEKTKLALLDSQNRVASIATLHSKLYKQNSVISIQLDQYIIELCNDLRKTFSNVPFKVVYNLQTVEMSVDKGIIVGLIVNEIVTNAIKHAFKDHADATLTVRLEKQGTNLHFQIADNGAGLSEAAEQQTSTSLGLKVIKSLSQQLQAELQISNLGGRAYILNFTP